MMMVLGQHLLSYFQPQGKGRTDTLKKTVLSTSPLDSTPGIPEHCNYTILYYIMLYYILLYYTNTDTNTNTNFNINTNTNTNN